MLRVVETDVGVVVGLEEQEKVALGVCMLQMAEIEFWAQREGLRKSRSESLGWA